jgi:signal transduction histidine kinase
MPVVVAGSTRGTAVATFDPATQIGQSWREASRLLSIMAFALLGLCVAVYAALARALRPTRAVGAGLNQLAANDLSARLPHFDLAELSVISGVFNSLAERLQTTLAERNALTRKLIEVQDEERRHLARELHDEFGQSLSAIAAQAAAAAHTAERECPPLYEECRGISRTTAHMMETLRGALVRLRPPDVEELGLTISLESLVASWNGFEKGRTRFEIAVIGEADDLPPGVSASLYRIAQEAITNAAKHAHARCVQLRLEAGDADIILSVEDDGEAAGAGLTPKAGMGLLGMQERVVSLGGTLQFERREAGGARLVARIPTLPAEP